MKKRLLLVIIVICLILTIGYVYRYYIYTFLTSRDEPFVCRYTTKLMSFDDNEKTVILLINTLRNKSWGCRFYAMQAMQHMNRDRVVKKLMESLNNNNEIATLHIVTLLGKFHATESGEMLISILFADSELLRAESAKVLGKINYKSAIDQLYHLSLNDESVLVRSHSALALARLGDQRAVKLLLELLQNKNTAVKMNAILGLALSKKNQTVIAALVSCLEENNDYWIRYQTIAALEKIANRSRSIKELTGKDKEFWLNDAKINNNQVHSISDIQYEKIENHE